MLPHPMLDQMQTLGLAGMASAYRELARQAGSEGLARDEWLGLMLDRETGSRPVSIITGPTGTGKTWLGVRSPVRQPGSTIRSSTCACRDYSKIWQWPGSTVASRA